MEKNWPVPLIVALDKPTTGVELADRLGIPSEKIEAIFINGFLQKLDYPIRPGDRAAFMPPGRYFYSLDDDPIIVNLKNMCKETNSPL
jgi:hypothetical protein